MTAIPVRGLEVSQAADGRPVTLAIDGFVAELEVSARALIGGDERRGAGGGLIFPGAEWLDVSAPGLAEAGWQWSWSVERSAGTAPNVRLVADLASMGEPAPIRDLVVVVILRVPDGLERRLEMPGNRIRPGVALGDVTGPLGLSTAVGQRGSPGIVALAHDTHPTVILWPFSVDELNSATVTPSSDGVTVEHHTGIAASGSGARIRYDGFRFDLHAEPWPVIRDAVPEWWDEVGVRVAPGSPEWAATATIFEVQLGFSVFAGGFRYSPYPDERALLADLPRIAGLGFDAIQLMPRQPYPSYNVHDYADISTTYGDETILREVVEEAHRLGLRVLLDILMHGVLDHESIRLAADAVRAGPYAERLTERRPEISSVDPTDVDTPAIAWSRHIIDFEPHWIAGSPPVHPMTGHHPDWFCTDSAGNPIGVYTKAFDLANPEWQDYFIESALDLVARLAIDGFRLDAPTYNAFPNWAPGAGPRNSTVTMGSRVLLARLRERLRREYPALLLYTEPSGPVHRESVDLSYNYDELWLVPAVATPASPEPWLVRTGRDLALWMRDRDATLPVGSITAHHIDSHDTYWWSLPDEKWRRQQFGLAATRAVHAAFALCGGAFMTFVGGEEGMEDLVAAVNRIRRDCVPIRRGRARFDAVEVSDPAVFAVLHEHLDDAALVMVNLSGRTVRAEVDFATPDRDLLAVRAPRERVGARLVVEFEPYQARVLVR